MPSTLASASTMPCSTTDSTQAPGTTGPALWWRDLFVNHSGHAHNAPEAFFGIRGKAKVFCERCLSVKIREVEFAKLSAAKVAFNSGVEDIEFRPHEVIVNELLQSTSVDWIACRKTNCLNHLRKCENQPEEIRSAARNALDAQNALRRDARRAKNKPSMPVSLPSASTNASSPGPPLIDNVTTCEASLVPDGSGAFKVSYSRTDTVPSGEALHVPHSAAAANEMPDSPTTFSDHRPTIIPDVAFEWACNMAFQIIAAGGRGVTPSPVLPYTDCSLPRGNCRPSASAFSDSYARTMTGPIPFDSTTWSSESYLQSLPETCTPYSTPMAFMPSWLPHTSGAGSPTAPMSAYTDSGFDDMRLAGMFSELGIAPEEQQAYSYRSKEPTPPPSFQTRTNTSSYDGSYDPLFACFY